MNVLVQVLDCICKSYGLSLLTESLEGEDVRREEGNNAGKSFQLPKLEGMSNEEQDLEFV